MVSLSSRDLFSRRYITNNRWCSKKAVTARSLKFFRSLELACLADTDSRNKRTVAGSQFLNPTAFGAVCVKRSYALNYVGQFPLVYEKTPLALTARGQLSVDGNRRPSSHWVVA
jgi:hypothetical protein